MSSVTSKVWLRKGIVITAALGVIGNSIAATACSDIQKDRKADKHKKPRSKEFGDLPKCRKTSRANLVLSPERIIPEAKIKAPRIKKIASLPNRA